MSTTASEFLAAAGQHMADRATTYDSPAGERSMGRTVAAFNAITGHEITEEQGWLFMEALKLVRSQQGDYREDNYEDAVAYAGLRGEAAARERQAEDEQYSTCSLCGDGVPAGQEQAHAQWHCGSLKAEKADPQAAARIARREFVSNGFSWPKGGLP